MNIVKFSRRQLLHLISSLGITVPVAKAVRQDVHTLSMSQLTTILEASASNDLKSGKPSSNFLRLLLDQWNSLIEAERSIRYDQTFDPDLTVLKSLSFTYKSSIQKQRDYERNLIDRAFRQRVHG